MVPEIKILRVDEDKTIRKVKALYPDHNFTAVEKSQRPAVAAANFAKRAFGLKSVRANKFNTSRTLKKKNTSNTVLWLADEKAIRHRIILEFHHYHNGLRVPKSGVVVIFDNLNKTILSAESTLKKLDFKVSSDSTKYLKMAEKLTAKDLENILPIEQNIKRVKAVLNTLDKETLKSVSPLIEVQPTLTVLRSEAAIVHFEEEHRKRHTHGSKDHDINLVERLLDLSLPKLDLEIADGSYRPAIKVLFKSTIDKLTIHWEAAIDAETKAILYLDPLVEFNPSGLVFKDDPLTMTGDVSLSPTAAASNLDAVRSPQPLAGAIAPNLTGPLVTIQDLCPISDTPPTSASGNFDYSSTSNDFSAVNAYYHNDAVFRTVQEMGFDMSSYFDGTPFPVPVDHRGSFACVNAAAWSNGSGLSQFTYGLADPGANLGITTDRRVVWHEFGHAILFDHVNSGNFQFAHSCGDSLAAINCDPESKAPDRFNTFPWIAISGRRHDRDPQSGWNWGGPNDLGGYDSEQILATSHFRAYQAIGGDAANLCDRLWASRYMTFLILDGVGSLTPSNNPSRPYLWSEILQESDRDSYEFECHPGGTVQKVIRWAFEKQGAYPGTGGVQTIDSRPRIDVYINDGRQGEYQYTENWCDTKDIWNRYAADGHPSHQEPDSCKDNFAYVIVRNRGLEPSGEVWVHGYHRNENGCCDCCGDCKSLQWPVDFTEMATTRLCVNDIKPGGYAIVGPFKWNPNPGDCMLFSVEAEGDPSNLKHIKPDQKVSTNRLIPWDNNLAIRCSCKKC